MSIVFIILGVRNIEYNPLSFAGTMGIIAFSIIFVVHITQCSIITEYEVKISDSIKYIEFTDKYSVASQSGKIYKVRERIK